MKQIKSALDMWSRKYICDEDPDERRERLREESLKEIEANVLFVVRLREAMRLATEREKELEEAA